MIRDGEEGARIRRGKQGTIEGERRGVRVGEGSGGPWGRGITRRGNTINHRSRKGRRGGGRRGERGGNRSCRDSGGNRPSRDGGCGRLRESASGSELVIGGGNERGGWIESALLGGKKGTRGNEARVRAKVEEAGLRDRTRRRGNRGIDGGGGPTHPRRASSGDHWLRKQRARNGPDAGRRMVEPRRLNEYRSSRSRR